MRNNMKKEEVTNYFNLQPCQSDLNTGQEGSKLKFGVWKYFGIGF